MVKCVQRLAHEMLNMQSTGVFIDRFSRASKGSSDSWGGGAKADSCHPSGMKGRFSRVP